MITIIITTTIIILILCKKIAPIQQSWKNKFPCILFKTLKIFAFNKRQKSFRWLICLELTLVYGVR